MMHGQRNINLLIIYSAFGKYLRKNGNKMKQCIKLVINVQFRLNILTLTYSAAAALFEYTIGSLSTSCSPTSLCLQTVGTTKDD